MGTDVEVLAVGADDAAMATLGALGGRRRSKRVEAQVGRGSVRRASCAASTTPRARRWWCRPSTFVLIATAVDAWRDTGGRYDPTVLAALEAAGYDRDFDRVARTGGGGRTAARRPSPGAARSSSTRWCSAVRLPPGVALDLGGIGKGFAADEVSADAARRRRARRAGCAREPGRRPARPWRGARAARLGRRRRRSARHRPHRRARAGGRRHRHEHEAAPGVDRGGRALHHLIDPRTGEPAESGLASVTVVAGEAWRAEVLAKAAFVAGADERRGAGRAGGRHGPLRHRRRRGRRARRTRSRSVRDLP